MAQSNIDLSTGLVIYKGSSCLIFVFFFWCVIVGFLWEILAMHHCIPSKRLTCIELLSC